MLPVSRVGSGGQVGKVGKLSRVGGMPGKVGKVGSGAGGRVASLAWPGPLGAAQKSGRGCGCKAGGRFRL